MPSRMETLMDSDVIILGAGVAGLFAAHELIRGNFQGNITLIEQGWHTRKRFSSENLRHETLCGVGGPGLFTDGKICLAEKAGSRLPEFIDGATLREYVAYVWQVLKGFLPGVDLTPVFTDESAITLLRDMLQTEELKVKMAYPVVHLGSERARQLAQSFEASLRNQHVRFLTKTVAQEVRLESEAIEIRLGEEFNEQCIRCRYLIAAVGKSGHGWLCKQLDQWNVPLQPNTPDLGIRLEFPNQVIQPLLAIVPNPRIEMNWNGTYIKTHCWCYGGRITTYDYLGSTFVDGEVLKSTPTSYSSVNLLYHIASDLNQDCVKSAHTLLRRIFLLSDSKPLVQSLGELQGDQQLRNKYKGSISLNEFQKAQLGHFLPQEMIAGFLEFIKRMDKVYPGIADSATLVYAPVVEWDTYRLSVDEHLRIPASNVYAVGDGAGLTQGVVPAATCGVIAARHLLQNY